MHSERWWVVFARRGRRLFIRQCNLVMRHNRIANSTSALAIAPYLIPNGLLLRPRIQYPVRLPRSQLSGTCRDGWHRSATEAADPAAPGHELAGPVPRYSPAGPRHRHGLRPSPRYAPPRSPHAAAARQPRKQAMSIRHVQEKRSQAKYTKRRRQVGFDCGTLRLPAPAVPRPCGSPVGSARKRTGLASTRNELEGVVWPPL
jgi:hypothetical protein